MPGYTNGASGMRAARSWSFGTPTIVSLEPSMRMMHEGCWWHSGSDWPSLAWRSMRTRPGLSNLGGSLLRDERRRVGDNQRLFNFLGFTHYCGATRSGKFMVKRKTQATRMARKLKELRVQMRRRWHVCVPEQHAWLCQVLRGHYGYYGVIFNARSLSQFYQLVMQMWFKTLKRRSRKSRLNGSRFNQMLEVFALPRPVIHQSWHGAAG